MQTRSGVALALGLAVAVGAVGYFAGIRKGAAAPDNTAIEAMVKETLAAAEPAPVAAPDTSMVAANAPAPTADTRQTTGQAEPDATTVAANQPAPMASPVPGATSLSDDQRTEVEGIIRNFLIANPEIIRDAINALQQKEHAAAKQAQTDAISGNKDLLFSSSREVILGNPKGDVTLVEFFDYNCAYCKRAHADMKRLIADDPNLRVVLKEFPILGDGSVQAAQIAVAVLLTAPEKYSDFHDQLITEKGPVDGAKALAIAEGLGIDPAVLKAKANTDEVKANITEVRSLADKLNLTGTPSYVTAASVIVGAVGYDGLKDAVAKAREACAEKTVSC
jgi:protein-disulfide isomerase